MNDSRYRNALLNSLSPADLVLIEPHLSPVSLSPRQTIQMRGITLDHVYFIEEGLVSVLAETGPKNSVEVCLVGAEGAIGVQGVIGAGSAGSFRRVVTLRGHAWRAPTPAMRRLMAARPGVADMFLRYLDAGFTQIAQTGACGASHPLRQRLAHWLLSAQFRAGRDDLALTHAHLARLLGARRASITTTLGAFEAAGLVRQNRGEIVVLDARGLTELACPCHRIVRSAFARAFPPPIELPLRREA